MNGLSRGRWTEWQVMKTEHHAVKRELIRRALNNTEWANLTAREALVLRLRYNRNGYRKRSLSETALAGVRPLIGKDRILSRAMIGAIEKRILRKLASRPWRINMSERMTDERLAEICQIKLVEYKDTTALLVELKHALKAEREENQRLLERCNE